MGWGDPPVLGVAQLDGVDGLLVELTARLDELAATASGVWQERTEAPAQGQGQGRGWGQGQGQDYGLGSLNKAPWEVVKTQSRQETQLQQNVIKQLAKAHASPSAS